MLKPEGVFSRVDRLTLNRLNIHSTPYWGRV
nr:MAG TPA: hypothetical protein [Caudoviricetes sp.]